MWELFTLVRGPGQDTPLVLRKALRWENSRKRYYPVRWQNWVQIKNKMPGKELASCQVAVK